MAVPIEPSLISKQLKYDIVEAREFSGDLLEDVNDHRTAHALWSMNLGDVDLACEFLKLEAEIEEGGWVTNEHLKKDKELLDRFRELQESDGDDDEDEDEEE